MGTVAQAVPSSAASAPQVHHLAQVVSGACMRPKPLSHSCLFVILWTTACQAPLSMGFSRQEILEWVAMPSSRDLPHPGIKFVSFMSPSLAGRFFTMNTTWKAQYLWVRGYCISLLRLPLQSTTDWMAGLNIEINFLMLLEDGSPRSECWQGWFLLKLLSLAYGWLLSCSVQASLVILFVSKFPLIIRIPVR